ncbi:protein-tyrosine phosphatase-like protein [Lasiosphaeris hirsuta]|uniref:Protein-tyrosine phosphatase-like protein n=1 Tax=Lasiosphaeris hirsuta TaxID=260670 RepID=A0AA40E3J5_9PEZI|nr:protein-tyrosine phosphatase-like protein [Lasiosphaeris hirsuta]
MATNTIDVPLPTPPFIITPGLDNLRDVGGYSLAAEPDKAIRRGVLFRSADLTQLGDKGVAVLHQLSISHVFDLRSVAELKRDGSSPEYAQLPAGWGAQRVFVPVFRDEDYSPEALAVRFRNYSDGAQGFVRAYASILAAAADSTNASAPFRTIIEHLAASPAAPTPILVHCTAGKDRTGVFCALVLALCGISDEVIAHEYSLTDLGLAPRKEAIVQHLIADKALFGDRPRAERMVQSRKENMLATLGMVREKYGSVESYVVDHCRVSRDTVEQLRRNLIVNIDANESAIDWQAQAKLVE